MIRRCAHDPAAPRLKLAVPVPKNLPRAWLDAIKRCERIYTHPQSFPELTGADVVTDRVRKRRAERLRSVALVGASMLHWADRRTLRVGIPRPDDLVTGRTVAEHARATGLCERCVSRALAEVEGKWWTSVQPVEKIEPKDRPPGDRRRRGPKGTSVQTLRGLPSVRTLTPLFFQRLGITPAKLARARRHGAQQWARRRARPASLVAIRQTFRDARLLAHRLAEDERAQRFEALADARLERLRPKPRP